jgi:hypothetical protein
LRRGVSAVCDTDSVATSGSIVAAAKRRRLIGVVDFILGLAAPVLERDRKFAVSI